MVQYPMVYRDAQPGPLVFRSSGRHILAGLVAVVGSVLLHAGLMWLVPAIPVGRPPDLDALRTIHSVELGDIRRTPVPEPDVTPVFQPSNPEAFVAMDGDVTVRESLADAAPPESPEAEVPPLAGEQGALIQPEPEDDRVRWEARQEVLAISKAVHEEEISVLPRRYQPAVPRQQEVPDVVLPATVNPAEAPLSPPSFGDRVPTVTGQPRFDVASMLAAPAKGFGRGRLSEQSSLLDEAVNEVTSIAPVEDLLALDLVTYEPEDQPDTVYFKVQINRKGEDALPVLPKNVLLLQDCSESMTQRKLDVCKKGMHEWLDKLNPEDHVEIVAFRNDSTRCFGAWTNLTPATRARANWFLRNLAARGKTDVYASLTQALEVEQPPDRPVLAVMITDGRPTMGMVDSSDIIETFTLANEGRVSVFAFGGGTKVNRYLLEFLGYKNRGDAAVVQERRDIPGALARWADELSRPVLTDLKYRFAGLAEADTYPQTLTHLYLDRPLVIYGRAPKPLGKTAFQVVGRSRGTRHDMVFTIPWAEARPTGGEVRGQWAWQRAYYLIGEHIRTGDDRILAEVKELESKYGLVVPYLSQ